MFVNEPDRICADMQALGSKFDADIDDWSTIDSNVPAAQWTARQREVMDAVAPVMQTFADNIEQIGMESGNPTIRDFATFAGQYYRAYAKALPTYVPADSYIGQVAMRITGAIRDACKAAGG
jgi:hypothetical protein